ncbi:MAG: HDOD domain-containing protein [Desulfovibrio sp.]|nr:MAG: HDOD domain-containing protein [Desulfovibrio sp.]
MKTCILFVDDEKLVLSGLRRMLAPKRQEWDMTFVTSGEEALAFLKENPCHIIVTDLLMPGMDGNQLLKKVQHAHPGLKRVMLTGQPSREFQSQTVFSAHQFLMKPCDYQTLVGLIEDLAKVDGDGLGNGLKDLVTTIESLPAIPETFNRITQELYSEEPSIDAVASLIAQDVALSSKLIALVNSPYYGGNKVSEPKQAVMLLGLNMIRSLVLTVQAFTVYDPAKVPGFSIPMLWDHSQRVACLGKRLALARGRSAEEADHAFLAGLLHDIGKLVLATHFPEQYNGVLAVVGEGKHTVHEVEEREFGTSHANVGAYLMGLWGIPANVTQAMFLHHSLQPIPEDSAPLFEIHLGNLLDHVHTIIHSHYALQEMYANKLASSPLENILPDWKDVLEHCQ